MFDGGKMQPEKGRQARNLGSTPSSSEADPAMATQKEERKAILCAQQGDLWGFEQIYRLHSKRVYAQCYRMLADSAEAEDVTQEVFLKLFRKIKTFRGESLLSTWLYRLTFNAVLMHIRRKNASTALLEHMQPPQLASGISGEEPRASDKSDAGIADRLYLERAISQLPWTWRLVFLLHDVHGYKHLEIARMMRCSVNTSKGMLHKAHLRLRAILLQNYESLGFVPGLTARPC
jgi:RNA polymerase sigma-70 factor (ECF subfamily)